MSKYEAQRAMKLAKYERDMARAADRAGGSPRAAATAPAVAPAKTKAPAAAAASSSVATCGHKSMNGRACTREAGHSEKSHRYS
jgi:hypothetical protein